MTTQNNRPNANNSGATGQQRCALCGRKRLFGLGWYQDGLLRLCRRCWPHIDPTIEWFESRYAILDSCIGNVLAKKPALFTLLGREQSHVGISDGGWLTNQVIEYLSLPKGDISFEFTTLMSSVAGTVDSSGGRYQVKMSKDLEDNFRSVSAILIHEMMHIYLNSRGVFYKTHEEYEEATDLACILMGFGVPMINSKRAWTVNRTSLGAGDEGGTSYHSIGYLSERQIGYAFATFLADRNENVSDIQDKIDPHCLDIVTEGAALERAFRDRLAIKRKALTLIKQQQMLQDISEFACPKCFQKLAIPNKTIRRVGLVETTCPKCHSVIHFDGERIVKFIESLR
jgi:ribosomal protein S14/predicted RNA-binding Zn-ribbon protein involved in translation (DUF1610 family)